jgi:hypothetical protein
MSTPSQFSPSPAPQPSGGGGMSVLMILLIVGGVLLLVCAGICGGCVLAVNRAATEIGSAVGLAPVYAQATEAVTTDAAVLEKLGDPVTPMSVPLREGSGELKPAGETFNFEISGPNGKANVKASAFQDAGSWKITVITVTADDGTTINVTPPEPTSDFTMPDMPEMPDMSDEAK